jgi:hypothetical protein
MNLDKLNEGSCGSHKRDDEEKIEEGDDSKFAKNQPPYDKATALDRKGSDGVHNEEQNEEMNEAKVEDMSLDEIQSFLEILKDMGKIEGDDIADMAKKIKEKHNKE